MSLGFGLLSAQRAPGDSRGWSDVYREVIELAVHAETAGFDSVWTTEHHFADDGYMPSLLVTSAAMAQATTTIAIGTGVVLAPLHHPLRLAEDAATVSLLSGGRLQLGLGLGWSAIEFEAFGADFTKRGAAMEEVLQILPMAWTGAPFRWQGDVYSFPEIGVRPAPESPIPLLVGGTVDAAVRRAARHADGFFSNAPAERFLHQVTVGREELERVGRDPDRFTWIHYAVMFPTEDPAEALPHIWHQRWKYSDLEASSTRRGAIAATPPLTEATARELEERSLIGSPRQIVEAVNAVKERAGVPVRVMARSHFATLDAARQIEVMDQLAEEVAPYV